MAAPETAVAPTATDDTTAFADAGYAPQAKKRKLLFDADRAEYMKIANQPGRVQLAKITWHRRNRGGQGILQLHSHEIALDVSLFGTSKRRYKAVRLVEVPESAKSEVLRDNRKKTSLNPLLSNFDAVCVNDRLYCCLSCTHFVEAHKLIAEGGRKYMDKPDGTPLVLQEDDLKGKMIQEQGVEALVYSEELWKDTPAVFAVMREDNLDTCIPYTMPRKARD